jgi:hypothetical protein
MRGITLCQPWAALVAFLEKYVETRPMAYRYRGPIAIHAAAGLRGLLAPGEHLSASELEQRLAFLCGREPFFEALSAHTGHDTPEAIASSLHRGVIVAVGDLVGITTSERATTSKPGDFVMDRHDPHKTFTWQEAPHELRFGNFAPKRYAWALRDVVPLVEPVACRGKQGLWNVPDGVLGAVREQFARCQG